MSIERRIAYLEETLKARMESLEKSLIERMNSIEKRVEFLEKRVEGSRLIEESESKHE